MDGTWHRTVEELRRRVEADPRDIRSHLKLGDLYLRAEDVEAALKHYTVVADHYDRTGFPLKCVAMVQGMKRAAPDEPAFPLRLAELYARLGLHNDSAKHFDLAASLFAARGVHFEAEAARSRAAEQMRLAAEHQERTRRRGR